MAQLLATFATLSAQAQDVMKVDPFAGPLFVFRGRRGDLIKIIWRDGQGACARVSLEPVAFAPRSRSGWSADASSGLRRRRAKCP